MRKDFAKVEGLVCETWAHKSKALWIVHYPPINRSAYFQAYRACKPIKPMLHSNNRRLGPLDGYETFDEAYAACVAVLLREAVSVS